MPLPQGSRLRTQETIEKPDMLMVTSNPDGVVTAAEGTFAYDTVLDQLYINTDGSTDWVIINSTVGADVEFNNVVAKGGVVVGSAAVLPSNNNLIVTGDIAIGSGLRVGATATGIPNGDIFVAGDIRINQGLVVGNTATAPQTDDAIIDGVIYVNETSDVEVTNGLVINQGTGSDSVVSLKNTNVDHGITDFAETDTFGQFKIVESASGGLFVRGYKDNTGAAAGGAAIFHGILGGNPDNTRSTAARAVTEIRSSEKSGTGLSGLTADTNLFGIRDHTLARLILNTGGQLYLDAGTSNNAWDEHDDLTLLTSLRQMLVPDLRLVSESILRQNREILEKTGIAVYNEDTDGSIFINIRDLPFLIIDAMRQMNNRLEVVEGLLW